MEEFGERLAEVGTEAVGSHSTALGRFGGDASSFAQRRQHVVEDLTAALDAARRIGSEIDVAVAGRSETEAALTTPRA
jgi:hypothetical protein